jgi:ribonuclease BN (tRNA processing enzyme)
MVAVGPVTLQFLGSGDALGSGGRLQSCLWLAGAGDPVLIDCGASSLVAMKRAGKDPAEAGWVVLSHLHGDHFGGIPFLVLDGQFSRRTRPLVVAGPPGTEARVETAMEVFFPGSTGVTRRFDLTFVELAAEAPARVGPAVVTPFPASHPSGAEAYCLRLEYGGKVIGYSGDTGWTESLVTAARGADLFVCEAYFFEKPVKYHLDYQRLARERARLECRRLILTHMSQDMLGRVAGLGVELGVEAAADGLTVTV